MKPRILYVLATLALTRATSGRAAQVPLPAVCMPAALGHPANRFREEFSASFAEAPTVDSIIASVSANSTWRDRSTLDSAAIRQLRTRFMQDSAGVLEALAGAIVDENVSTGIQAHIAARYYKAIGGSPARLFAAELRRFGFGRRVEILRAIKGPLKDDEWPVVLGYACDAIVEFSAIERDSSFWDHRDIGPDQVSLEFVLRQSIVLLPPDVQRSLAPSVKHFLDE